jgi:hypothetical protein
MLKLKTPSYFEANKTQTEETDMMFYNNTYVSKEGFLTLQQVSL